MFQQILWTILRDTTKNARMFSNAVKRILRTVSLVTAFSNIIISHDPRTHCYDHIRRPHRFDFADLLQGGSAGRPNTLPVGSKMNQLIKATVKLLITCGVPPLCLVQPDYKNKVQFFLVFIFRAKI